ncbi:hypothetical protein DLREEDagr8_20010 [Dongia sp. agr-C8]
MHLRHTEVVQELALRRQKGAEDRLGLGHPARVVADQPLEESLSVFTLDRDRAPECVDRKKIRIVHVAMAWLLRDLW